MAGAFIAFSAIFLLGVAIGLYGARKLVDLPEEIGQITKDAERQDTLLGWQDNNGVIHIGFKH